MRGSEATVETLRRLGVDTIFGLCGDTTLPLYEALHDLDVGMHHVLTRDERSASFMADAYARLSGKIGVCEGPSGGGATYIIPGVAEANESSVPMICLTTDIDQADRGRGTLTELDHPALFAPITRFTRMPESPSEVESTLREAFLAAATGAMGAAHVGLSFDVQSDKTEATLSGGESSSLYPLSRPSPAINEVKNVSRILTEAKLPLIVAGAGVLRSEAWEELTALAHLLGTPVATSISGKGSIAETNPYALGVIGSNGGLSYRHELLRRSDVIFYVGCRQGSVTTDKWSLPVNGEKTILQLDVDPLRIGHNYETAAGIVSDAKLGLQALVEEIDVMLSGRPAEKINPEEITQGRNKHLRETQALFASEETPIRPERFLAELLPRLPQTAVLCVDPGTPCPYFSAYHQLPLAGRWFVSPRAHGALGYALPAVCGAWYAKPNAERVIGVMGDGSFGISCGELETYVRLKLPVTLIVLNNSGYGWIKAGQKQRGEKYYKVDFSDSNHAAIAEAFGLESRRVEDPNELGDAIEASLTSKGPYLLDVVMQPLEEANAPVTKWIS